MIVFGLSSQGLQDSNSDNNMTNANNSTSILFQATAEILTYCLPKENCMYTYIAAVGKQRHDVITVFLLTRISNEYKYVGT